jgi:hypothetical protein
MNLLNMSFLEITVLLMPAAVAALGLVVYWLTGWMDRREDRRHHAAE